jgi:hypothetical protein
MNKNQRKTGDPNITDVKWLKLTDIHNNRIKLRSGEIKREVDDYLIGKSFPLNVIDMYVW